MYCVWLYITSSVIYDYLLSFVNSNKRIWMNEWMLGCLRLHCSRHNRETGNWSNHATLSSCEIGRSQQVQLYLLHFVNLNKQIWINEWMLSCLGCIANTRPVATIEKRVTCRVMQGQVLAISVGHSKTGFRLRTSVSHAHLKGCVCCFFKNVLSSL